MTKSLYLVRHAKAGWDNAGIADFDRPLNEKGLQSAPLMASFLKDRRVAPCMIVSSPALRALSTAGIFSDILGYPRERIEKRIEIYEGGIDNLHRIVQALPDDCVIAMLFGHNPSITDFSNYLTGRHLDGIVTCGIVRVDFNLQSWAMVCPGSGRVGAYDFPKQHQ
jgi:phosphohistidine phosphatase